jgi:GGDEF domain-containing protein
MYENIAEIMYAHHERYDGSGYPRAIKGDEIPLFARIMMVADSFDAMTTSRIYKERKSVSEAIKELKNFSNKFYDPNVIDVAVNVLKLVKLDTKINQNPISNIDYERFAYFYKDLLTHVYNHSYLDLVLHKRKEANKFVSLNIIYIKNFTLYNRKNGWSAGDKFLSDFATYLQIEFADSEIFRIFGYNFVILNDVHKDLEIEKINEIAILKDNNLYCVHKCFDSDKTNINSYVDLAYGSRGV